VSKAHVGLYVLVQYSHRCFIFEWYSFIITMSGVLVFHYRQVFSAWPSSD